MLEIDDLTLKTITSTIDELLSIAEEKKDLRIVSASLTKVANKIRAMAEIRETPDNRFVAFIVQYFFYDIARRFEERDDEWYQFNKELVDQCLLQIKNFLTGLKSSLNAKSFEKTIDVIKIFFFAYWQTTLAMTG